MSNRITQAMDDGAEKLGKAIAKDAGKAVEDFYRSAGNNLKKVAENTAETDAKHAADLAKILHGEEHGLPKEPRAPRGGRPGHEDPSLGGPRRPGQAAEGNRRCTKAGDPVDVVSGQMITSASDLELPGLLPLVIHRSYASGYRSGRWFGHGWSTTLDQRVQIDAQGIHYAGDDAQIMHYPRPVGADQKVLPYDGTRWPLTWDRTTDTILIEDPETGWTRHFAATPDTGSTRAISALTDRNGHRIDYLYEGGGLPTGVRHSGGYQVAVDIIHTAAGPRIDALRLLDGTNRGLGTTVITYGYDVRGRLAEIRNSSGTPLIYGYDDHDQITSWTDRNSFWYEYEYGADGRVAHAHGSNGVLTATFEYNPQQRVTTVINSFGRPTHYHYDQHHHVTKTVDAVGNAVHTEYDPYGRLLARTDELGHTTRYTLDANGKPIRIDRPDGTTETASYNELGLPTTIVGADDEIWRYTYDGNGNLLSTTDPLGAITTHDYDAQGRLAAITDPSGATWRFETDPAGLHRAVTDPLEACTRVTRDAFGRVVTVTDPVGGVTRLGWTVEGKPAWRIGPDGARDEWECDDEGNLLRHTATTGGITTFEYGPFNQAVARTGPDGARYTFRYDSEMRLAEVVNPQQLAWSYTYDACGRLIAETDFNGSSLTYRNDAAGRPIERTNGRGETVRFVRDPEGRVTERRADGCVPATFRYDGLGRLVEASADCTITFTRDAVGRVLTESVDGQRVVNEYDLVGRRVRRITPSGAVSEWTYDANGLPLTLATLAGGLSFARDKAGRETTRYLGQSAAVTQTWDAGHRLTAQSVWAIAGKGGEASAEYQALQQRTYRYRADGLPTAVTDMLRGERSYDLDALGRVTTVNAAAWTENYAYDALGNVMTSNSPAASAEHTLGERTYTGTLIRSAGRTTYEHDTQGRLVRTVRRTLSGKVLQETFDWDACDRLIRATTSEGQVWEYRYDPLGRRLAKQRTDVDSSAIQFTWDDDCLAEQTVVLADGRTSATTWDWEPDQYRPITQVHRSWTADVLQSEIDQRFFAIVTDLVGTPSELVTHDGQIAWYATTDLWGSALTSWESETDCPLRYPGQYHDEETGWNYNYHRYYDSTAGRYLTPDPLGLAPALNHHSYVENPLSQFDPLGLARAKRLRPDPDAVGPHTTFRRDGTTGRVTHYAEWVPQDNPHDPAPWKMTKRADMVGPAHFDRATGVTIPTPHVNMPDGTARAADPWEITPCP